MQEKISQIKDEYLAKISSVNTLKELDEIFLALFGKNGVVTQLPKEFSALEKEQLRVISPLFNQTKQQLEEAINRRRTEVREEYYQKLTQEEADFKTTVPLKSRAGSAHPLLQFEKEISDLFGKLGFQLFDAPHIDTDYNNFEVLNIPEEHPARDLWDTLYIDTSNVGKLANQLLLRTHTSNAQIRILENFKPPIRMMVLGRCFRYENLDARHEHTFDQFELVYVDKGLSMANLQYLSEYFLQSVLGKDTKVRLRPKYYPFVEPGVGIDGLCLFCKGEGCKVCGYVGWLELGGAGMIHPQVLKNGGIDPNEYTGIAWGPGLERILMLKLGVGDVRLFRSGDLKFLKEARYI
ncbi:MAG: Phenylalanine-tRNA ligase alpha subunit [Candidatus Daviesbacteria bacterium GW2011_GWA2_38_24]|uniref:Phenylalanine--tRNA ligase alpha subunit n=1 Tax=Candidatus Daviesbacteria bacterium GW2011_GWA2_38_24 TaxID=1618422 RepID=A0A0G0JEZ0_9BACT|nr:MAG: Phenylalanine-tRNA ligase alpha subunit [Candidatus Daviesbacteria bacterium GW2011_GWA2_38_24]KKQ79144.1 MAG: Phenylalanine-tRNA ligase alpha subunit [Candidatus Daviesbacteria bacterium GW2011_GWA1_38_7]